MECEPPPIRVVLDTHVVLDWLVFGDPRVKPLSVAILKGEAVILTHAHAIEELARVLAYPKLDLPGERQSEVSTRYVRHTTPIEVPISAAEDWSLPSRFPKCRDPDDQFLLAIAYHGAAPFLITRDRQLLKLRKSAAKFGFAICTPEAWDSVKNLQYSPFESARVIQ